MDSLSLDTDSYSIKEVLAWRFEPPALPSDEMIENEQEIDKQSMMKIDEQICFVVKKTFYKNICENISLSAAAKYLYSV